MDISSNFSSRLLLLAILSFAVALLLAPGAVHAQSAGRFRGVNVAADITPQDVADLSTWNVNVVRYPLISTESDDLSTGPAYAAWLETALAKLDARLPVFEQHRMKVLVNLFSPPGDIPHDALAKARIFQEPWAREALNAAWQTIATRYAGNVTIYGYDLLNEPAQRRVLPGGFTDWNTIATGLIQTIRSIDAERPIVVQSTFGDVFKLSKLKRFNFTNIIYSIHWYYPLSFQHQGLYGRRVGVKYPKGSFNKNLLKERMQRIVAFQKKHKVKIFIGEFSAVRWAPGRSAFLYLKDTIDLFEKFGWSWTYHAFREADPWSLEHGSDPNNHDMSPVETDRLTLLKRYFQKNKF
ncbi:MAG: cellulase family glycosylhydrolase [Deltaproteobacteria bacterium]|jgi:endoglucanase|nr:cellulase family glycosylhydrolase [Deltaproteobacteria bacterium]